MKEIKDLKLKSKEELRKLDATKLNEELKRVSKEEFVLRMKKEADELKQTHLMKFLRRYIALVKTISLQVK